jgi:DNA-binding transcriptional MerR regulator
VIATQKDAASALGITTRQLRTWASEDWFPPAGRTAAGWDVEAIKAARDREGRKGSEQSEDRQQIRALREQEGLERDRIRTTRERLALQSDQGELIPRAAVELFASTFLTIFGQWCDQLPVMIARDVPAKFRARIRDRLSRELEAQRQSMRDELEARARAF